MKKHAHSYKFKLALGLKPMYKVVTECKVQYEELWLMVPLGHTTIREIGDHQSGESICYLRLFLRPGRQKGFMTGLVTQYRITAWSSPSRIA
jgi:hypothetical protein